MYFNPYETKKSKKARITSNIILWFIALSAVFGIIYIFFGGLDSGVEPIYFKSLTIESDMFNEKIDSFDTLLDYVSKNEKEITVNERFKERFPEPYSLLTESPAEDVYYDVFGNDIVIAQCFASGEPDWRDLEVIIIKVENDSSSIMIYDYVMYKISYNVRTGTLNFTPVEPNRFHLTPFIISIDAHNIECDNAGYTFEYSTEFKEKEVEKEFLYNVVYDPQENSFHQPEYEIAKGKTKITATADNIALNNSYSFEIKPNRDYLNFFGKCIIKYDNAQIDKFSITIN